MFRLATCNDLIRHKNKYPDLVYPAEHAWGLKQMGTLFCYDQIKKQKPKTVIEIGAGRNNFFDKHIGNELEYWMADSSGFYDKDIFRKFLSRREHTMFVDTLIGEFSKELPYEYFDISFSISVIEHIETQYYKNFFKNLYAILKPGGVTLHSIDIYPSGTPIIGDLLYKNLKSCGFEIENKVDLNWSFDRQEQILIEPFNVVYNYYYHKNDDCWIDGKTKIKHIGTILVIAKKPYN